MDYIRIVIDNPNASAGITMTMGPFLQTVIDEARAGLTEGGIPIGAVLVHEGRTLGRGHNRRIQRGSLSSGLRTSVAERRLASTEFFAQKISSGAYFQLLIADLR